MRKWLFSIVLVGLSLSNTGCILPIYSGDPAERTEQLIYTSENLRNFKDEWFRFWLIDQPSHMSPVRTHGGIL